MPFSAAIVGAGAIGCHIAWCLRRANADVYIVARGDTFDALSTHGLRITVCGEQHVETGLHVVASDETAACSPMDYVILTVKMYSLNEQLLEAIKPLIGPNTTILPPTTSIPYWWCHEQGGEFNGMRMPALDPHGKLWEALPPQQCLGLTYWLSSVQEAPGVVNVKHIQRGYPIGELGGGSAASPRANRLAEALRQGGVPAPVVDDIRGEIFTKAVNSMAFNAVAVLSAATNGQMADCPQAVDALRSVMAELEQLSAAMSLSLNQTADERISQTLASRAHTMSMLHDLKQGKELEVGPLFVSFQALADLVGVSIPLTTALVQLVKLRKAVVDEELGERQEEVAQATLVHPREDLPRARQMNLRDRYAARETTAVASSAVERRERAKI